MEEGLGGRVSANRLSIPLVIHQEIAYDPMLNFREAVSQDSYTVSHSSNRVGRFQFPLDCLCYYSFLFMKMRVDFFIGCEIVSHCDFDLHFIYLPTGTKYNYW